MITTTSIISRRTALLFKQFSTTPNPYAKASPELLSIPILIKESDHIKAREWIDNFKIEDIPKDSYVVSRSRSSGPGGQHVNKTESKITLRLDLTKAKGSWLPGFVFEPLTRSPHYLPSPATLLLNSQTSRTASQNLTSALTNLHETIVQSTNSIIINPTSVEQKTKVKGYIKKENEKRLELKKRKSMKRASRRDFD